MLLVLVHSDEAKIVSDAGSRVMQGILTGIVFLGAGVIVHAGASFQGSRAHQCRLHLAGGLQSELSAVSDNGAW